MRIRVYTVDFEWPRWLRRSLIWFGIPAVVCGIAAVVWASWNDPSTYIVKGNPVSAQVIRDNFNYLKGQLGKNIVFTTRIDKSDAVALDKSTVSGVDNEGRSGWVTSPVCRDGEVVLGGGCEHIEPSGTFKGHAGANVIVTVSKPEGMHWTCYFKNVDTNVKVNIYAYVQCGTAALAQ
jgi:hypothetical protein